MGERNAFPSAQHFQAGSLLFEPNPTPAYRVRSGSVVAGYRLIRRIGRGWESTSYLAESASGMMCRVKLYRDTDADHVRLTASAFERFHVTGIVPRCHEMGIWLRNARDKIPFLVFDYIEGKPLTTILRPGCWRRSWRPETALGVLRRMATKIAAVHKLGRAVGDFEHGSNILLRSDGDAVWCDLDPGSPDEPNTWIEGDRGHFFSVVDRLAAHQPANGTIQHAAKVLSPFRDCRVTERTFGRVVRALDPTTPLNMTVTDVVRGDLGGGAFPAKQGSK